VTAAPRRPRGRPRGGEHVVDREGLLDLAEQVIARDGHGASLDAIALEAGVTKPIVYARIGGRAALADALAVRLAERLNAAALGVLGSAAPLDRALLAALFRTTLETVGAHRELFLYVTRGTAGDTPERTLYLAGHSAAPMAELLAHWRSASGRDPDVAVPWAYAVIGMLNLATLWWTEESSLTAAELASMLADLVWPALAPG
jgi:AcrR family transcriptional regulator